MAYDIGAPADPAATSDDGSFSLISLVKRLLGKTTAGTAGAANLNVARVAASTAAATLVAARATRRRCIVKNTDTGITVYIGPATVTSANGFEVKPGESVAVSWPGLIQVIAASGTPAIVAWDEYD